MRALTFRFLPIVWAAATAVTTWSALALLSAPMVALGQAADYGAIEGTVLDPAGRPVAAATLTLTSAATGATVSDTSDGSGLFHFHALTPGSYALVATAATFAAWQAQTVVSVGSVTSVRATLPLSLTTQSAQVHAIAPVLDPTTVAVSTTLDPGAVTNLPSSTRRWTDFALLTPAVTPDAAAQGLLSFRGIGALLNNNTLDGADNNQAFFSEERGRTTIAYSNAQSAVQEFQVNASNYDAQYGRAAGGVINTVTRSGGNAVHGQLFYYDRNSAWNAANAFATATVLTTGTTNTIVQPAIHLRDTLTQYGGTVGGPILKDKLFLIFTYDRYHRDFPAIAHASNAAKLFFSPTQQELATLASRLTLLPAQALTEYNGVLTGLASLLGNVPRTADQTIYFPKLDWQISERSHLTFQWNTLRWNSPNGVQTSPSATYGMNSFGNSLTSNDVLIARYAYFLSPNLLNEATFQYGRDFESETSNPPAPFEQALANNIYGRPPQVRIQSYGFSFGNSPVLDRAAYPDERRYEAVDALTWVRGPHTFKLGYSVDFVNDYSDALYDANGTYVYSNVVDFATDYLSPNHCDNSTVGAGHLPCYSYYQQAFGPTTFQFQSADYSGFVSDQWKATPTLSISLGLRYEYEQLPNTNASLVNTDIPQTARLPHDNNNFGPRFGIAWNPGSGSAVLRGGAGVYYGRIVNSTAYSALTQTGFSKAQRAYYFKPLDTGTPPFPFVFSGTPYLSVQPAAVYFDPHFQNPQIIQTELAYEQKVGRNTTFTLTGMYSGGRELPSYIDTNIDLSTPLSLTYDVVDALHQGPLPAKYTTRFYTQRLNTNYGQVTRIFSETNSKYAAAVIQADHNLTRALDVHASFTYAHAEDWNQNATAFTDSNDILDPANLALEYGSSDYDIRRRLTGGLVLQTPWKLHGKGGLLGALLNGYELAPTAEVRDGLPYSMQTSGSIPAVRTINVTGQAVYLSGLGASINGSGGANRLPTVGRNTYRYPGIIDANLRISKRTQLYHGVTLELLGESFNVLNHRNITSIDTTGYSVSDTTTLGLDPKLTWQAGTKPNSSQFGTPLNGNNTSLYGDRQIQVSARLHF